MRADIEQDIDGKLWLLVDVPGGGRVRVSHEMATADPLASLPPIKIDPASVKWPDPPYRYFMPGLIPPADLPQWIGGPA